VKVHRSNYSRLSSREVNSQQCGDVSRPIAKSKTRNLLTSNRLQNYQIIDVRAIRWTRLERVANVL
jgi:hypothetical protein